MAAVIICSDFGTPKNSLPLFPLFPHLFPMKWWDQMPWSSFSECWALSQLFHSPLSLSSRGFSSIGTWNVMSMNQGKLEVVKQGGLPCCNSWGHKELDTTERLNWTELNTSIWPLVHLQALKLLDITFQEEDTLEYTESLNTWRNPTCLKPWIINK